MKKTDETSEILKIEGLKLHFPVVKGFFRKVTGHIKAVDGISFSLKRGETLALVGESGSGKTTTGLTILREYTPTEGSILFYKGKEALDVSGMSKRELRAFRLHAQMVFQDPYASLNPRMTIRDIIAEPLIVQGIAKGKELEQRLREVVDDVGLRPEQLSRYPHAFSGGQRQRIAVARALTLNPELLVADEPVSALDVSVQAQVLNLFQDLQKKHNLSYLFIAHDLSVVQHIADRVAVMYLGNIVEMADSETVFANPRHPYTEALLAAVPIADPRDKREKKYLKGELPNPADPPVGCDFNPRCPYAADICRTKEPSLKNINAENEAPHFVSCHFPELLS